ncbi:MAG: cytochrome b [Candidatus Xenolissoclinum pacificiensis L6]|uniref:Cytochrome b n=1 Tax=Candidatus Xenolissoclinum pacificiensis L6 TaxID=1401685 RepID=W2V0C7_9RICK|nr:MAG: cytochrome b [Candidatus Xenolissoclinum pacificiensis L6]
MSDNYKEKFENVKNAKGIYQWIDTRIPILSLINNTVGKGYYAPKNLSYLWNFGVLAFLSLLVQIVTGVLLAMHYKPDTRYAFESVEIIMRDVNYGWLLRYTHAVGASMFFSVLYVHIFRGMYYGSYKNPRELLWFTGVVLYIMVMASGFLGYVLPWGQMSFWGATVITSVVSAIPFVGDAFVVWVWGGYSVDDPTLNRFFVLHFLIPILIAGMSMLHVVGLHQFGSNNPVGIEVEKKDKIPFYPYYIVKDMVTVVLFFLVLFLFVFFAPNYLGHPDNYIEADPLVTPMHIVPEWYFLPFYAILRAIPNKLGGVIAMLGALFIWFVLPWLDFSKIKSGRYRPYFRSAFCIFIANFFFLMWLGGQPAEEPYITLSRLAVVLYFAHFLVILPLISKYEKPCYLPDSIND